MTDTLPLPVIRYLAARSPEQIAECFTEDGIATDERQTHHGRAEIRKWREGVAGIDYRQDILSCGHEGDSATVNCRLTGDFPGSPVDLTYRFGLSDGLIAKVEIA